MPDGVREHLREGLGRRGRTLRDAWTIKFEEYRQHYPSLADHIERIQRRRLPSGWDAGLPTFPADPKGIAGPDASAHVMTAIARNVPWLIGGSVDLAPSTETRLTFDDAGDFSNETPATHDGSTNSERSRSATAGSMR